jgi:hypothetical protein
VLYCSIMLEGMMELFTVLGCTLKLDILLISICVCQVYACCL